MKKEEIFWNWFKENEKAYHFYDQIPESPQKDEITLALGRKLHEYCDYLYFALIQNFYEPEKEHFIITAHCNKNYFEQAFKLIEYAPHDLSHWIFEALLPPAKRYTEHYTISYEDIKLDPKEIWFRPLANDLNPLQLGIMLFIKDCDLYEEQEDIGPAVEKLLLTEIGELSLSLQVHYLDISPLPPNPEKNGCFQFSELANIIKWYYNQQVQLSNN